MSGELLEALGRWRLVIASGGVLIALFLLLPLVVVIPSSLSSSRFLVFPPPGISGQWFAELLDDPQWTSAFLSSAVIASAGAIVATVTGTLAALAMRRAQVGGRWLRTLFLAPLIIPQIVFALGLYNTFDALRVVGSTWSVVLGQAILAFPIVFILVSAGLGGVDAAVSRAAVSLGARWPSVIWRIELPLVRRSVMAAFLFSLVFIFDEIVIALFLTSPTNETVPVKIFRSARDSVSPEIAAASTVVIGLATLVLGAAAWLARRGKEEANQA